MIPGLFRFVCTNGMVCSQTFGEIRVPHKGDVVGQVIEGVYEGLDVFDSITESREIMKDTVLSRDKQEIFAQTALGWRYDENAERKHISLAPSDVLIVRRNEDKPDDLWTTYQRVQENMTKGRLGGNICRDGIDGDAKLNWALWRVAEMMKALKS
ncbi:DUF932 domain-containing protein [Leclercia adecarboxylata]|uniref:DUF932 domain-containing protein n=1 Tax=Leclercia adecarboxylata TaxID=83655 RepID=UPI001F4666E5|nr:DUF932 domain-containing protein [Leclercia adecarboxylata]